jgi:hypothetical protein
VARARNQLKASLLFLQDSNQRALAGSGCTALNTRHMQLLCLCLCVVVVGGCCSSGSSTHPQRPTMLLLLLLAPAASFYSQTPQPN